MENTKEILSLSGYEFKIIELLKKAIMSNKIREDLNGGNNITVLVGKAIDGDINLHSVNIKFNKTGKEQLKSFPVGMIGYSDYNIKLLQCNSNSVYFTMSGKMDGKVTLNRHIIFDIVVSGYNLSLDANIVLLEYSDRNLEFIKLFNKINSIRMIDDVALNYTRFEFTNTYARIKIQDNDLSKINIANTYKYYLDYLNSSLNSYYETLNEDIKGE